MDPIDVTIVIPVYNEQAILEAAVADLRERLAPLGWRYEIVLAENGSRDATARVAADLGRRFAEVHSFSIGEPNYGKALRQGIATARGTVVICEEIDLCDVDFQRAAVDILDREPVDMVVGSKLLQGAHDNRPWLRHAASRCYNAFLRATLGFRGTDTHGLKAFRRATVGPVVERCVVDGDVFASELVIRTYRAGLTVREIPVRLAEKRPPSVNLLRRVPKVTRSMAKLLWAIHVGSPSPSSSPDRRPA